MSIPEEEKQPPLKSEEVHEEEQGSVPTKPPIVGIGEEFYPYTLPQEVYGGFPPDDIRLHRHPRAATVTLRTELLPNLDFQIVTIPPSRGPEAGEDRSEIIVESSITQALQLGLIHRIGRRSSAYHSWQPYGFNEDVLPLVKRLRFSFIDSESASEAKPEEDVLHRGGQIKFKLVATEGELTPELRAGFNLGEDPIEAGIRAAARSSEQSSRNREPRFIDPRYSYAIEKQNKPLTYAMIGVVAIASSAALLAGCDVYDNLFTGATPEIARQVSQTVTLAIGNSRDDQAVRLILEGAASVIATVVAAGAAIIAVAQASKPEN